MSSFHSKQEVNCSYCKCHGRHDKLLNHVSGKHPNEKPRTKDQQNILSLFKRKTCDQGITRTEDTVIDNDVPCSSSDKPVKRMKECDKNEPWSSPILQCNEST